MFVCAIELTPSVSVENLLIPIEQRSMIVGRTSKNCSSVGQGVTAKVETNLSCQNPAMLVGKEGVFPTKKDGLRMFEMTVKEISHDRDMGKDLDTELSCPSNTTTLNSIEIAPKGVNVRTPTTTS